MSAEFRTKYEVIKILRDRVMNGLAAFGQTEWDCMEFGQASFQSGDRLVTMRLLRLDNAGFQGTHTVLEDGGLYDLHEALEEQDWQMQIVMKKINRDVTGETYTSEDVASRLIVWFNSVGVQELRKHGIGMLRVDSSSVFVYNDDSDVYQKRAVFTVKIFVPKVFRIGQDALDVIKPDILPV